MANGLYQSKDDGHSDSSPKQSIGKGEFKQIGTYVDLKSEATSPNQKTGSPTGGEK